MKVAKKHSPTERLVAFFKEHRSFLTNAGIDANHYLVRIEQIGALVAVRELVQQADPEGFYLPPGYWRFIDRLKQDLEKHQPHA
jgi:hypothetical protein